MIDRSFYDGLGYPLGQLPGPGQPITEMGFWDTIWPLLEGVHILLRAVGVALETEDITGKQANTAIAMLDGHLATAMHLLNRWEGQCLRQDRRGAAADDDQQPGEDDADGHC